jgi:LPXTG-site transpeptidase (sortase) family protein
MASLLFIVGVYVAIDGWLVNRAASTQTQVLAAQSADTSNDRDNLTEDKPSGTKGYKVAPDLPRTIQIPSIGVDARVLQLGVKANNELATPTNIHDAGWYTGSSKPTDKAGAILIDGHVSGPTKRGVFYDLKKLKAGDELTLERGDGVKLTFAVTRTKTVKVEEVDMGEMMRSDVPAKLALNLITCGGSFDVKSNEFASRVLVFAVQK